MQNLKSEFLRIVHERGFFHQCTDINALDDLLCEKEKKGEPLVAYIGFDCTAKSLHVGSLIQIMMLYWLQQCGHKPIVLMGGGTTKIGDPSGKDESRQLLSDEDIAANMEGIKHTFAPFLEFEDDFDFDSNKAFMVNNYDWLRDINYIEFLRDYGKHFSVNRMMSMDSVKLRLERDQNLSFLEFNYMILQAYDFRYLAIHRGCRLQIGGSDQWGNIVNGVELFRRRVDDGEAIAASKYGIEERKEKRDTLFGLTTPLLTTSSGAKMGKTAAGAVWLNADMFSPYDYWQYWRNTEDADVGRFLRLFTTLPMEQIKELESAQGAAINEAKKILANEVTALCHGRQAAEAAAETARKTFEQGGVDAAPIAKSYLRFSDLDAGHLTPRDLLQHAGFAESGGEARRLIEQKGVKVNDIEIFDPKHKLSRQDLLPDDTIKVSKGKKSHARILFVD